MEPLTIALAAGAGYLLLKGAGGGAGKLSDEQLAATYVGKPTAGTPSDVVQRFVNRFNALRASGAEGWVVHGIDPAESAKLGPTWNYITGRLPGPVDASWWSAPGLVWRRTEVKKKVSGIGAVLGAIGSLAGGVVKTTVLPGSGAL